MSTAPLSRSRDARRYRTGWTSLTMSCPITTNVPRKLSDLQADDPMVLTLARGHYCPKEHQQHLDLAANYPKINVAYTRIVTISTDSHHTRQEFRNSTGAQWTSSPTQSASSRRTSTSRSTPILRTTR